MKSWAEPDIAIVYFADLFISLVAALILLRVLHPARIPVKKNKGQSTPAWLRTFSLSLIFASLLGAMSVSFRDCHGNYDTLLNSKTETIMKGLDQVSSSVHYLYWVLLFWLILFIVVFILAGQRGEGQSGGN